jgi:hypothetical protein
MEELGVGRMSDERVFLVGMIIGIVVGILFALHMNMDYIHSKAIKHGCGEYNKATGDFQWKNVVVSR